MRRVRPPAIARSHAAHVYSRRLMSRLILRRYLKAIELESLISDESPDSVVIETAAWYACALLLVMLLSLTLPCISYIEAGLFAVAADVIDAHPLRRQPPLYISKLCARMRNLSKVSRARTPSRSYSLVRRICLLRCDLFEFTLPSDVCAGQKPPSHARRSLRKR